jgi:hypothetical protein
MAPMAIQRYVDRLDSQPLLSFTQQAFPKVDFIPTGTGQTVTAIAVYRLMPVVADTLVAYAAAGERA